jgi:hypothetical protein
MKTFAAFIIGMLVGGGMVALIVWILVTIADPMTPGLRYPGVAF